MRLVPVLGPDPPRLDSHRDGVCDGPSDTSLSMHIFVSKKGDYYEIADELSQNET